MSSDRKNAIQKQTADLVALTTHILDAVERQREDERLRTYTSANELVIRTERVMKRQIAALESLADAYDAELQSRVKKGITELFGLAAGVYNKLRDHKVSRMLRDNYTALSLTAMAYTLYHTFGLAIDEERIATLAQQHLEELTPLIVDISQELPQLVVHEMQKEFDFPVDASAAERALANTQHAWSTDVTESA